MFDVTTALALNAVMHLACTLVMGLVYWKNPLLPGLREWALGRGLLVVSFFYFLFRAGNVTPVSVIISNVLLLVGIYTIWLGNCRFMRRELNWPHRYFILLLLLISLSLFYFTAHVPDYPVRASIISASITFYAGMSIWIFWPRTKEDRYVMAKMIIATHMLMIAVHLFRTTGYLGGMGRNDYLSSSLVTGTTLVGGMFVSILTTVASLALVVEFLQKELVQAAERDALTGAYNRRAFFNIADGIFARSTRDSAPVAVLSADLDYFKRVNDQYGHKVGDLVLQHFVSVTRQVLRGGDLLARFGGEEFIIILPGTRMEDASKIAERIRMALIEHSIIPELPMGEVTCSIGLAGVDVLTDDVSIEVLIEQSDKALYQAKVNGRNRISRY